MTDYSELVKALRTTERICRDRMDGQVMLDAADAIEALQAEVDALKHDIERYVQMNTELLNDRPELEEIGGKWVWKEPKRGEIVRCKECKWYGTYYAKKDGTPDKRYSPSVCLRGKYAKRRDPEWFCADGEREVRE